MKSFEKFLESHYITDITELSESLYQGRKPEIITESKSDEVPENYEVSHLKHLDRIILIGEMRYKSLTSQDNITVDYADPTKLQYELSEDKIHVFDGEYEFDVTPQDKENTIVLIRSGYKNPVVSFLLDEMYGFGLTLMNKPDAVSISNNKYLSALLLDKHNLPQPKYCLVSKQDIHKGDHKELDKKLKKVHKVEDDTKFVCKILGGHGGQGVFLCTGSNITSVLQTFFAIKEDTLILVQEYEKIKEGDIRAHVLTLNGKQELLNVSMRKKGTSDFRTNLSLGNTMEDYTLTDEQKDIVFAAAKASGLTWCGVDLLPLENGKNVILELNGAPGPPSEINSDDLEKSNEEFFKSFIDTVNKLIAE